MNLHYVIGSDVSKSLSPLIHNYLFKKLNIDAIYKTFSITDSNSISKFLLQIKNQDIRGVNVTNPYKEKIIPLLDHIDNKAKKISSVNCIALNEKKQLSGWNTDWYGFVQLIISHKINLIGKKVKIIGYGGAGRSIEYALYSLGILDINIYTRKKIDHPNSFVYHKPSDFFSDHLDADIIINATPFHFINDDSTVFDEFISRDLVWIDLLYTKLSTEKYKKITEKKYFNGLEMLIHQALESINIWYGKNITKSVDLYDLKERINAK